MSISETLLNKLTHEQLYPTEEQKLEAIKKNDTTAIVYSYLLLVKKIVLRHGIIIGHPNYDDAFQSGIIGIIEAIETFNHKKSSLDTWVYFHIRSKIQHCIADSQAINYGSYDTMCKHHKSIVEFDGEYMLDTKEVGKEESKKDIETLREIKEWLKNNLTDTQFGYIDNYRYGFVNSKYGYDNNTYYKLNYYKRQTIDVIKRRLKRDPVMKDKILDYCEKIL